MWRQKFQMILDMLCTDAEDMYCIDVCGFCSAGSMQARSETSPLPSLSVKTQRRIREEMGGSSPRMRTEKKIKLTQEEFLQRRLWCGNEFSFQDVCVGGKISYFSLRNGNRSFALPSPCSNCSSIVAPIYWKGDWSLLEIGTNHWRYKGHKNLKKL